MSLQLRSRDGSEYLIQHDSEAIISTWHKAIAQGIQELVSTAWGLQRWWGGVAAIMQGSCARCGWGPLRRLWELRGTSG